MHTISTVENPAAAAATRLNGISDVDETSKDQWSGYEDEQLTDLINDPNDPENHQSEGSDFEDAYIKRKRKSGRGKVRVIKIILDHTIFNFIVKSLRLFVCLFCIGVVLTKYVYYLWLYWYII